MSRTSCGHRSATQPRTKKVACTPCPSRTSSTPLVLPSTRCGIWSHCSGAMTASIELGWKYSSTSMVRALIMRENDLAGFGRFGRRWTVVVVAVMIVVPELSLGAVEDDATQALGTKTVDRLHHCRTRGRAGAHDEQYVVDVARQDEGI